MFVDTSLLKKTDIVAAIGNGTAVNTSETDSVRACTSLASLEKILDDLGAYMERHPEREFPVQKILLTYPQELETRVVPREFFITMHNVVVDILPFGCMIGSVQGINRDITIIVNGKPVVYHTYMEIYIIPPEDLCAGFQVDIVNEIHVAANTIARAYGINIPLECYLPEPAREYEEPEIGEDW